MLHNAQQSPGPSLARRYESVRSLSVELCKPLSREDMVVQSMPDASPAKWHLAHTSWFFETFLLKPRDGYEVFQPRYERLFNSYYNAVGPQHARHQRGLITRPGVRKVLKYRAHVDQHVTRLLEAGRLTAEAVAVLELGLNHEQQHQELLLMDIQHALFQNPACPAYSAEAPTTRPCLKNQGWLNGRAGEVRIGASCGEFCFDNERPRHSVLLIEHQVADDLVSNRDYLAFVEDGGYRQPALWLADGWTAVNEQGWAAPLYWTCRDGQWFEYGLRGLQPLDLDQPVRQVSFYEADAYASWADARLPTEAEWESAATRHPGRFADDQLWQWTASAYQPYPGFKPASGALGEYNGKFMCNQMVLRGGSFATPTGHSRPSYRNFYFPHQRWMYSGIRLARDV